MLYGVGKGLKPGEAYPVEEDQGDSYFGDDLDKKGVSSLATPPVAPPTPPPTAPSAPQQPAAPPAPQQPAIGAKQKPQLPPAQNK
jgi:hypothetical protein